MYILLYLTVLKSEIYILLYITVLKSEICIYYCILQC